MAKSKDLEHIEKIFEESIAIKKQCVDQGLESIVKIGKIATSIILNGNKIMLCGNGGSAADAQHLAAEMLIRLHSSRNREGIPAIALAQDTSSITACGNDFGFDKLYQRMVFTLGKGGDCLIAISTSGNSKNIILAMQAAQKMGIKVFGFLGSNGGKAIKYCDEVFLVPSNDTGRIQETHIIAGHALMDYIEAQLLKVNHLHLQ
tara:strand:+ start:230 stop:841 length:612 start_codon:yes stop_codon:yes gene_type:complete